jgi:cbb3-type cytochrome oxidase subunit 3
MNLDVNLLREATTVISFLVFIGIVVYAVHPRNRQRFTAAATLPPDEKGD